MSKIGGYSKVYAIGHHAIQGLLEEPVLVEEKIDGSQFSFADLDGELVCRSHTKDIIIDAPEKMFNKAVAVCQELYATHQLHPGWVYRAEYLQKPKHNTLTYDRIPEKGLVIYDIDTGLECYLDWPQKNVEAKRLGLEVVPILFHGRITSMDFIRSMLDTVSFLGGTKIEGVVAKRYGYFTVDGKTAMGKYVSELFKEKHVKEWKKGTTKDVVQNLILELKSEARWQKSVQHLKEAGQLDGSLKDIGPLIRAVPEDILEEEKQHIMEELFNHFWPQIRRAVTGGLPEWYKEELAKKEFEEDQEYQLRSRQE